MPTPVAASASTCSAGWSAFPALPGLAVALAVSPALIAPALHTTSGPNQATTITSAPPATSARDPSRHVHAPYPSRNGQISGRRSPAAASSTNASRSRRSRCATIAHSTNAASHPSELPSAALYAHHGPSAVTPTAPTAAARPPSMRPRRQAPPSATKAPVRARISHNEGARSPASASGVVNSSGSGFHEGPSAVVRPEPGRSRPHTSQA